MSATHTILFYVDDPLKSASFYEKALGTKPLELSPGFGLFQLNGGTMLGLWNRNGVLPSAVPGGGTSELGLHVATNADVDQQHRQWSEAGVDIIQPPTQMDFGYTCTARDPDGHRIRVFAAM